MRGNPTTEAELDETALMSAPNFRPQTTDYGLRTQDSGLRTTDSGLRTQDSGFRSQVSSLYPQLLPRYQRGSTLNLRP